MFRIKKYLEKLRNKENCIYRLSNSVNSATKGKELVIEEKIKKYVSSLTKDVNTYLSANYSRLPFDEFRDLAYNDSQVASLWNTRLTSLAVPYRISENNSSKDVFSFVKYQFSCFDIYSISKLMMNAVAFGFSALELTWKLSSLKLDKETKIKLLVKEIDFILNEQIEIKDGNVYYLRSYKNSILLNPYKVLLLINGHEHGDLGYPLFSTVWKEYKKKELTDFYHLNFIKKLTGVLILVRAKDKERTQEENEALFNEVTKLQNIYSILLNTSYDIELKELTGKSSTNETFLKAKTYCDEQIAKVILGQTLTTESGTTGSYALGKTHEGVRMDYASADRRFCESGFNALIKKIVNLNFGEQDYYPEFSYKTPTLERDAILTRRLGVKFSKDYISENYNLNKNDFEIDISLIEKGGK